MTDVSSFVSDVLASYITLQGEPRELTKREQRRLEQARELERKADDLRAQADELEYEANRLKPKDMYPNSVYRRLAPPIDLPIGKGKTLNFQKIAITPMGPLKAEDLANGGHATHAPKWG